MSFPNRTETKTHTSFSKSGSQLTSFKTLSPHETSNCLVWILYIILLFDLQFTNKLTDTNRISALSSPSGLKETEEDKGEQDCLVTQRPHVPHWPPPCHTVTELLAQWAADSRALLSLLSCLYPGRASKESHWKLTCSQTSPSQGSRLCARYSGARELNKWAEKVLGG